jgi:hypothetical protein
MGRDIDLRDDDREDDGTRNRVDEIGASMESYRERLDARYRVVVGAVMVMAVAMLAIGGFAWKTANGTGDALCSLRQDLERRVAASERFLVDHPSGVAGITPREIKDGIRNQKRTIKALSDLDCDPA